MEREAIRYEVSGRIATITLNRPERGNAMNDRMHKELHQIWREINQDDGVWAAIVRGAGSDFCVGEDAQEIADAYRNDDMVERWKLDSAWQRRDSGHPPTYGWPDPPNGLPGKPLVAAVHGRCEGSAMLFPAFADFTIATDDATFSMPHVSVGTAPVLEVLSLTRMINRSTVLRLALLGKNDRWTADRARQLGLVVEMCSKDNLDERLQSIMEILVERSAPLAVRAARTSWWKSFPYPLSAVAGFGTHYPYMAEVRVVSQDAKEGPSAFAQKRKPNWQAK